MGWCLYLDGANSLLGGQSQPFIQDGGGSGISPAETLQAGVPRGRAEATQAQREPPLQDNAAKPQCGACARSVLPSPLGPREEAGCHGVCHHAACLAWSPVGLSPGGQRLPLRMEVRKETLSCGKRVVVSHHLSPRVLVDPAPSHSSLPLFPHPATPWQPCCIYPFDQSLTRSAFLEDLWGSGGSRRI